MSIIALMKGLRLGHKFKFNEKCCPKLSNNNHKMEYHC